MEIPEWFTPEFFEKTLRKEKGAEVVSVKIKDVELVETCGANFSNTLYRVTLMIDDSGEVSLVVKTPPFLKFLKDHILRESVFEKEANMYRKILPAMYDVAAEKGTSMLREPLAAGAYDSSRRHVIIMDDLTALNMTSANQRQGLDFGHCIVALRALARFHALSAVVLEQNPRILDTHLEKYFIAERRDEVTSALEAGFAEMASVVDTWCAFEHFGPRLRAIGGAVCDVMIRTRDVDRLELAVLTHGDFWAGNVMFGYGTGGKPCRARFVDFQSCRLGSPVLDMHCFFTTSPCDAVRERDMDELLKAYYDELCRVVRIVDYGQKVITLDQLRRDMRDSSLYSLLVACTFLNMVLAKPGDLHDLTEDTLGCALDRTRNNPTYRKRLQKLLLSLSDDGLL
ncbi:hypothetical protein PR048_020087 [Dryococelus australis]|uniref:CHK kinase-like domain-containing protein n=1 Tax=Dryococelus australis TaxID=614101 RepID=A0ABQ9H5B3_9NEOP|nr:hypothetical protein PR048_020087 [Dryococelus australis]